jgi:hypothetical protein
MKKPTRKVRSSGRIKAGIKCPACGDVIFSLYRHDFRRCQCGKVFIDGGDDYMRAGAEPPILIDTIQTVYRPQKEAERLMSPAVRDRIPMAPPPKSYSTDVKKFQLLINWKKWHVPSISGPFPKTGKFIGAIYRWSIAIGPLELRRWEDGKGRK